MAYVGAGQNKYTVFPVENYTFGQKTPKVEKQRSLEARFKHLKEKYAAEGMRRSVEGIVLVHKHNTLHVLLMQPNPSFFKLPGGKLKPGEDEISGLQRKLTRNLAPEKAEDMHMKWQVADCLASFYRPNFETLLYPYCPTHIERPKEIKKLFLVNLPERAFLTVPRNLKLIAVPIFELHDHVMRYGPVIAALPLLLSRLQFTLAMSNAAPSRPPPAAHTDPASHASQNQAPNFGGHGGGLPPDAQGQGQHMQGQHTGPPTHGGHAPPAHYGGPPEGYGMM